MIRPIALVSCMSSVPRSTPINQDVHAVQGTVGIYRESRFSTSCCLVAPNPKNWLRRMIVSSVSSSLMRWWNSQGREGKCPIHLFQRIPVDGDPSQNCFGISSILGSTLRLVRSKLAFALWTEEVCRETRNSSRFCNL